MQLKDKYFGMTRTQLGILAGLAVTACLLFGLAGWFVLRGGFNRFSETPQSASVSQSTATPWAIPSPAPTATSTALPYETLIPSGWSQFKTGLVELWLPAEFQPGDPQFFNNSSNTAIGELILKGSGSESSLYQTLVLVSYEPLTAESLDVYLDAEVARLPADIRIAERRRVTLNGTEAVRFVFETRYNNVEVNDLTYVFLDGGTIWYVEYIAQINEFFEKLSVFEKSAQTFRVVR
jgi:hypothetical protein